MKSLSNLIPDPNEPIAVRRRKMREFKDVVAKYGIGFGGIAVIIAVVLIFFYLTYVVAPMFVPASVDQEQSVPLPGGVETQTLLFQLEEQAEIASRFTSDGRVIFFDVQREAEIKGEYTLPLPEGVSITSANYGALLTNTVILGLSNGTAMVVRHAYDLTYPNNQRNIEPRIEYPLGEEPMALAFTGSPIVKVALANVEDGSMGIVGVTDDNRAFFTRVSVEESLMGDVEIEAESVELPEPAARINNVAINYDFRRVFLADDAGVISMVDTTDMDDPSVSTSVAMPEGVDITEMRMLLGGISLLVGRSDGQIDQFFAVRDDNNQYHLTKIRDFKYHDDAIVSIQPEAQRKGFLAMDKNGFLTMNHATAERVVHEMQALDSDATVGAYALSPRSDRLLVIDGAQVKQWKVHNEHPDISFSALWDSVWYEGYDQPEYLWQSSAANQDFEPKYSLVPLAFGTLKAAFYAMLVAMPLAIMGAIFTAYFMSPAMRVYVKPTIEIMEALPTVILGFLAGLWLAPLIDSNLPGIITMLIVLPISMVLAAYGWHNLPRDLKGRIPEGWQAALLIPLVILVGWVSMSLSHPLEVALFGGDFPRWLTDEAGIGYDQRNSIVVGAAMGFAVIPTIFSIAEDAVFGVPKHLTTGSLALGASPWQTLVRVVIPSASPGIFSAVMIGMGRAVGETMIVLMATGNTPVINANIFEGMRTLSANIAVEMPESEVGSSHYRVLFLAALVLFLFTFVLNTVAEIIRQRLRKKYASL